MPEFLTCEDSFPSFPFALTIYLPLADNEHRQQVAARATAPPPRPQVAEDRGAGMPRRRRRGMHAAMEARRPQREASDDGMQCFIVLSLVYLCNVT